MTHPHDIDPDLPKWRREARGLGIVEDDNVPGCSQIEDGLEICSDGLAIGAVLIVAEWSAVPRRAVEPVVEPLCDPEKLLRPLDDQPTGTNPSIYQVPQQ
jgi:hypothetical protein